MEFALVRPPGVLAQGGAADLLLDRGHIGQRQHVLADALAHRHHFLQRGAGRGAGHLHHEMAFAEIGHEAAAQEGQQRRGRDRQHRQHRDDDAEIGVDKADAALLPGLHPLNPAEIGMVIASVEHQRRQSRRGGQRHGQRGQHRQDEGQSQRPDEFALHAGGEQRRQEHNDDDQGGIDHRSAHFQGRVADDVEPRTGLGQLGILAQPAQDILDADDGVVHQHAQRHRKAAQGHGVQGHGPCGPAPPPPPAATAEWPGR